MYEDTQNTAIRTVQKSRKPVQNNQRVRDLYLVCFILCGLLRFFPCKRFLHGANMIGCAINENRLCRFIS